jgi:translation initiation factor 2 gamma subunit (eIF-2gamma)
VQGNNLRGKPMASVKELNDVFDYKKAITTTFDSVLRELVNDEGKKIRTIKPDSKLLIIIQNAYVEGEINHFNEDEAESYFFQKV